MKFSSFLPTAALAAALAVAGTAQADDTVTNVNLGGNGDGTLSAHFGVTHTEAGSFIDTFNFSPTSGSWFVDSSLVQIGFQPSSDIDFHWAEINGHAMTLTPNGVFEYGWMINEPILGPLVLTVYGTVAGLGGGASASFAGTINISPIPEPGTYGMLLGGLGMLAWMSRRKFSIALKSA
ncbi:FxDxF family PEP-CTERM protein [Pseudoduganella lutea]|uniref:PEP-CTERM sorting domain-containing protein n=1 Tax=Pseudoduganella lutea TaxID=321985 RepID=A0A4P6KY00_9BURK|nr:FxDxF family PEP-CTERM protein [Pseudoduganella lutea]QBE63452.1 PEP-CTERM sorting domain-containing protein [Pseudoduganella lutea]